MNEKICSAAFDLLARREYSEKEMQAKLWKKFPDQKEECQAVIRELLEQKYIDDDAYAQHWTEYYAANQRKGRQWYRQKLLLKGISPEICERILAEYFSPEMEYEAAKLALSEKLPSVQHLPPFQKKAKLLPFLTARGFSFSVAQEVISV
ncbi:MAG: regulatory protein RecX [Candidatus Peregrinibacteria bacterium]